MHRRLLLLLVVTALLLLTAAVLTDDDGGGFDDPLDLVDLDLAAAAAVGSLVRVGVRALRGEVLVLVNAHRRRRQQRTVGR